MCALTPNHEKLHTSGEYFKQRGANLTKNAAIAFHTTDPEKAILGAALLYDADYDTRMTAPEVRLPTSGHSLTQLPNTVCSRPNEFDWDAPIRQYYANKWVNTHDG